MRNPTSSSKHSKKPTENPNNSLSASIELVKGAVAVGEMLPVAGGFVKGLAGTAVVFLENLERFEKNKEDVQVLARDITDVVVIVRDAGIKISAEPENLEYVADLKNACAEFQKFLSDLTTQVIDIERTDHGLWRNIKKLLTSKEVQEKVKSYRQVMEGARSNLLLSLNLESSAAICRITHGVAALQSSQTNLTTITCDIQRDVAHIRARTSKVSANNNKFHGLIYGDIQCRDIWSTNNIHQVVDGQWIQMGEVIKYAADVSTSSRVMVVKEYSGSVGLQEWERDFHAHSMTPRHPNLRQLYGVVKSEERPCLVFHGTADEIPFDKFHTLFDKHLRPLVRSVLYHSHCSVLKFVLTHWGVSINGSTLRCAPDGRLIFDDFRTADLYLDKFDKLYVNDFENILDPVSPEVQWSFNHLMLWRQEANVQREHLSSYYRVMTVEGPWCITPNIRVTGAKSSLIGAFIFSDQQEHCHFVVDCLGEGIPQVKLSVLSLADGELLEIRNGLWRFIHVPSPNDEVERTLERFNDLDLGFTCSMELTSDARSQHVANWFSQGPRILAKISESLEDTYHPDLVISHINKRRFRIRLLKSDSEVNSDSLLPEIPYVFVHLPFMCQNAKDHSITLPEIYLSMDPQGAKPGVDCAWRNSYKLEVEDMGDSGLFVSRVNLEMACRLQELCGLRTASLDTASFLNQRDLTVTFQMINWKDTFFRRIHASVRDNEEYPVTWDKIKEYSVLMKSYDESKPSAERERDVPSTDESPKDESNQNINVSGPQSLSIEDIGTSGQSPIGKISPRFYVISGILLLLLASTFLRTVLIVAFLVYISSFRKYPS